MAREQSLESKINASTDFLGVLSLGSVVLSGILLFTPVKAIGYIGIGSGMGVFTASVVSRKNHLQVARQHVDGLTKHHHSEIGLQNNLLASKDNELDTLGADKTKAFKKIEALKQELNISENQLAILQNQIDGLTAENQAKTLLIEQVNGELDRLFNLARTIIEESLSEWDTRLNSLVNTRREQYPKLTKRLEQLLEEGQQKLAEYTLKLANTPRRWDSLSDLFSIYYVCNDDLQNIRVKAVQAIAKLTNQETLIELQEYQTANEEWQVAKLIPRSKVEALIGKYEAMLAEFRVDLNQRFENAQSIANAMEGELSKDEQFFLRLKSKIQDLESEVHRLSKPLEWRPATRADMKVANIIIRYFEQLGVILDRAGTEYKQHEAKLWFLPDRTGRLVLADELNEHSDKLQVLSHILNSPIFKLDPESGLIHVTVALCKKPAIKEVDVSLMAGTANEFIDYITSHPIRYRLIADPGEGKTPITAVMVSEILKVGGTRGNTGKGKKIPNTLITVSCPDVESSQKDVDYPLEVFLKYGNTTAAVKSIGDALDDWQYRKRNTNYADNFFQLWVWDELDNTLSSASDPKAAGEEFKKILKQAHHTGVGWIVSGQSVMTSMIPGFMDDDRELFTQIIIGSGKIRKYLEKYGKKVLSSKVVNQLSDNLDSLDPYIEEKNALITDAARLIRLALVLDGKSPKLYFLPNLDSAKFDSEKIEDTTKKADLAKRSFLVGTSGSKLADNTVNPDTASPGIKMTVPSNPTIGGSSQSRQKPHCPHCGKDNLNLLNDGRYRCLECKKRFVANKTVWK